MPVIVAYNGLTSQPIVIQLSGSPAKIVLSNCVDPPRNQCRAALRDSSPKKSNTELISTGYLDISC